MDICRPTDRHVGNFLPSIISVMGSPPRRGSHVADVGHLHSPWNHLDGARIRSEHLVHVNEELRTIQVATLIFPYQ